MLYLRSVLRNQFNVLKHFKYPYAQDHTHKFEIHRVNFNEFKRHRACVEGHHFRNLLQHWQVNFVLWSDN